MIKLIIEKDINSNKKRFSEKVTYGVNSIKLTASDSDWGFTKALKKLNYKFLGRVGEGDTDGTGFFRYAKKLGDFDIKVNCYDMFEDEDAFADIRIKYTGGEDRKNSMREIYEMISDLDLDNGKDLQELEKRLMKITNESTRRTRRSSRLVRESKEDTVYVVFRKERKPTEDDIFYGNDVTAFIYGEGIPVNYGKVMCYQHVGQHGEASLEYYNSLKPASPDEYEDLLAELKSIYDDVNLVVRKKLDYNILSNEWRR